MTPRGQRVPWWADPGPVSIPNTAAAPINTTEDVLQGQGRTDSGNTQRLRRTDKDRAVVTARRSINKSNSKSQRERFVQKGDASINIQ